MQLSQGYTESRSLALIETYRLTQKEADMCVPSAGAGMCVGS